MIQLRMLSVCIYQYGKKFSRHSHLTSVFIIDKYRYKYNPLSHIIYIIFLVLIPFPLVGMNLNDVGVVITTPPLILDLVLAPFQLIEGSGKTGTIIRFSCSNPSGGAPSASKQFLLQTKLSDSLNKLYAVSQLINGLLSLALTAL